MIEVKERNTFVVQNLWLGIAADEDTAGNAKPLSPFLGPEYSKEQIKATLDNCKLSYDYLRNGQLIVATNLGVFVSRDTDGGGYEQLGSSLPTAPVLSLEMKPKARATEKDTLIAATNAAAAMTSMSLPTAGVVRILRFGTSHTKRSAMVAARPGLAITA